MFFDVFCEDQDVIHIDDHPTLGDFSSEYVVHHSLKFGQSEEHYQRFKEAPISPECGFPLVTVLDPDIVISPANVHLRKIFCLGQFVY
ncbi:hypothetical protein AMATHDRAFT_166212 [Amanita thiersii Skay4041]|uniref:Uncharacterized protein n=1 Tax=Amanita thiersii Skay4041 TaxID=703135 RepID=A0A2A9N7M3_9AGAR|nr:hypothetical protein AMATHDRAFT_166212 [Amanita thiersii Skay4041]